MPSRSTSRTWYTTASWRCKRQPPYVVYYARSRKIVAIKVHHLAPRRHEVLHKRLLETLANLVAAGYGTTLAPQLAAASMEGRGVVLRPLNGKSSRTIRLASRPTFPRPKALQALVRVIAAQRLSSAKAHSAR